MSKSFRCNCHIARTGITSTQAHKSKNPAAMADAEKIKMTAAKVLGCVEKVSSFASSIDPLFGIVSTLVGVARKGLVGVEAHALEKDFQAVHSKLESISAQNQQVLGQIHINEVNEIFSKYEEYIKHQYTAFNNMVERVKKDPKSTHGYMTDFANIYERDKSELSLDTYYRGVIGAQTVFGRPLLKVYQEHCNFSRAVMEHRCSHLGHLFHIGLIALMGYTAATEDDEDEVREKWTQRVAEIQAKMEEALAQCERAS